MRDEAAGAHLGKGVPWRLVLVHVLWQGEGRRVRACFFHDPLCALVISSQLLGLGDTRAGTAAAASEAPAAAFAPVAAASPAAVIAASALALPVRPSSAAPAAPAAVQSTGLGGRIPAAATASEDPATSAQGARGRGGRAEASFWTGLLRHFSFRGSVKRSRTRTTQAIGQQHTSPLRAGCEARRREIVVIFGCGNGAHAPEASKVDGGLRAGGPQWL